MKKKAIALIPLLVRRRRRRRRDTAQRGAKLSAPAVLAGVGAAAAYLVRRRRRSAAGFDASPSELSGTRATNAAPSAFPAEADAPPTGEGRPSTFEGDPAETVPKAGIEGVGENSVIPDTGTDDPSVVEAEAAAAAEAGAIGGDVPDTPPSGEPDFAVDPATRPVEEHSGNSFESFSERES